MSICRLAGRKRVKDPVAELAKSSAGPDPAWRKSGDFRYIIWAHPGRDRRERENRTSCRRKMSEGGRSVGSLDFGGAQAGCLCYGPERLAPNQTRAADSLTNVL